MMLADLDEFHTPDDKEGFNAIILGMAERVHNISDHSERAPRARQHLICTRLYPAPVSPCASLPTIRSPSLPSAQHLLGALRLSPPVAPVGRLEGLVLGAEYAAQQLQLQQDSVVSDPFGRRPHEKTPTLVRSMTSKLKASFSRGSWQNTWSAPTSAVEGLMQKAPRLDDDDNDDAPEGGGDSGGGGTGRGVDASQPLDGGTSKKRMLYGRAKVTTSISRLGSAAPETMHEMDPGRYLPEVQTRERVRGR